MSSFQYALEKAHIDWTNLHTQLFVGFFAVFFVCLTQFLAVGSCSGYTVPMPSFYSSSFNHWLQVLDFAMYFASCVWTGLISLEITGRFGNRLGASCAIWSALLVSICPLQVFVLSPVERNSRLVSLLILLLLWSGLRGYSQKVSWVLSAFAIGFILFFKNECTSFTPYERNNLLNITLTSLGLALFCFMARSVFNRWTYKTGLILIGGGLLITMALAMLNCPLFCVSGHICFASMSVMAYFSAIIISLSCLPAMEKRKLRFTQISSFLGLLALIIISLSSQYLFTSFEKEILVKQASGK